MARARRGRGEGGVYRRESDGLWVGTVSRGADAKGRRRRKTVYGKTKAEALGKLRELLTRGGHALDADAARLTAADYLAHWLEHVAKPTRKPTTYERYAQVVRTHLAPALGAARLAALGPAGVEALYADLRAAGAGARTVQMAGTVLGTALKDAARRKLIPANPVPGVAKATPPRREPRFLTAGQARRYLAAAAGRRLYPLFLLALSTGLRQGELFGLQWADVDFARGTLAVRRTVSRLTGRYHVGEPKTKASRRTIGVPADALAALDAHRRAMLAAGLAGRARHVFVTRTGGFLQGGNLRHRDHRAVIARANAAELAAAAAEGREPDPIEPGVRFHDLRHTHASLLLSAGHSVRAVSARLGHTSVEVTLRYYAHVMPGDDDRLTAAIGGILGG